MNSLQSEDKKSYFWIGFELAKGAMLFVGIIAIVIFIFYRLYQMYE